MCRRHRNPAQPLGMVTCCCVLQVSCLPNFQRDLANRVFVDVMNEPDSMQIRWEGSGSRPGAHQLYLGTADTLWQMTPDAVMFMFEGGCCVCLVASAHTARVRATG